MKKLLLVSLIMLISLLNACTIQNKLIDVEPSLAETYKREFYPPLAAIFEDLNEFDTFTKDQSIFTLPLNKAFVEASSKYNDTYFESNYLIMIITQTTSRSNTGFKYVSRTLKNQTLDITIEQVGPKTGTTDMGPYYTYFFEITNKDEIKYIKIILK